VSRPELDDFIQDPFAPSEVEGRFSTSLEPNGISSDIIKRRSHH